MQIDKVSARQLLHQSLPVPPHTLSSHQQVNCFFQPRSLANVAPSFYLGPECGSFLVYGKSETCAGCHVSAETNHSEEKGSHILYGCFSMSMIQARTATNYGTVAEKCAAAGQVLGEVGQKARTARQQNDIQARSAAMQCVEAHPSYALVVAGVLATSQGIYRTPTELSDLAEAAATAQVRINSSYPEMGSKKLAWHGCVHACRLVFERVSAGAMCWWPAHFLTLVHSPMRTNNQCRQRRRKPLPRPRRQPRSRRRPAGRCHCPAQLPNGIAQPMSGAAMGSPAQGQSPAGSLPQQSAPGLPGSPGGMSFGNPMQPAPGTPGGTPQVCC